MKTVRCEQCASTDLLRVGEGEYVCNHCTARMVRSPAVNPPADSGRVVTTGRVPKPQPGWARQALTVLGVLAILFVIGGLRAHLGQQRADERRRLAIKRSVAKQLAVHFGSAPDPATPAQEFSGDAVVAPKAVTATFTQAVALPDSIGNVYFIGIYKNTGEAAIDHPRVEATLWDAGKAKLAVASGFAPAMTLLPGEEIPIKILAQHPPAYAAVSYKLEPQAVRYGDPRHFNLRIDNPRLVPDSFSGYQLAGSVINKDKDPVQHAQVIALLLGSDRQIVGMQEGYVAQRVLPAGDACPFTVRISQVHGKPTSFKLFTSALLARE